jgi:hypothetical protein
MRDLNNRPGGPNHIVTAKTAHKVFELATGRVSRQFSTAAGCEFIVGYRD